MIFENVTAWAEQILVVGSLGALLPLLFRIRHPRSQLAYCHLVLVLCLALPLLQRWQHATVVLHAAPQIQTAATSTPLPMPAPTAKSPIQWDSILVLVLVSGAVLRLSWLVFGL